MPHQPELTRREGKYVIPFVIESLGDLFDLRYNIIYDLQKGKHGRDEKTEFTEVVDNLEDWSSNHICDVRSEGMSKFTVETYTLSLYTFLKKDYHLSKSRFDKSHVVNFLEDFVSVKNELANVLLFVSSYKDRCDITGIVDNTDIPFLVRKDFIEMEENVISELVKRSRFYSLLNKGISKQVFDSGIGHYNVNPVKISVHYENKTHEFADIHFKITTTFNST